MSNTVVHGIYRITDTVYICLCGLEFPKLYYDGQLIFGEYDQFRSHIINMRTGK